MARGGINLMSGPFERLDLSIYREEDVPQSLPVPVVYVFRGGVSIEPVVHQQAAPRTEGSGYSTLAPV